VSAVIAGYARTPFGRMSGRLAGLSAVDLGAVALRAALERTGVPPERVRRVIAGQVLQAAAGQNPARQTAVAAGIPFTVPAITLNAVCLSGLLAVAEAAALVERGVADVVAVVGQESMTQAPHAARIRGGAKYGSVEMIDTLEHDGLSDAFERTSMGASTEAGNVERGLTRESQDAWAAESHRRAAASAEFLAGEIVPVELRARGAVTPFAEDEGVRADTTTETLGRLRAAFASDGTITAGNSSQISDGAAALLVLSPDAAAELGVTPIAEVLASSFVAGPDVRLHSQPSAAIAAALASSGSTVADLALIEVNEAFAAVSVQSAADLGVDPSIVNVDGGAIALGHPIGASGTRIVGTLARRIAERGAGTLGAAGICGGGGQGAAVVLRAL
jgi:acetyl-CoA C-acetyltransferase